jgi:hypothetical protein
MPPSHHLGSAISKSSTNGPQLSRRPSPRWQLTAAATTCARHASFCDEGYGDAIDMLGIAFRRAVLDGFVGRWLIGPIECGSDLVTSRAQSMNSRATGLMVLFLRVTTAIANGATGRSIGSIFSANLFAWNCRRPSPKWPMKRPLSSN